MKLELSAHYKGITEYELLKYIEAAIKCNCSYICVSPQFTKVVFDYLQNYQNFPKVSTYVDFPDGADLPQVKLHAILAASKNKTDAIDIPLNLSLYKWLGAKALGQEYLGIQQFSIDHNLDLRVALEYSYLNDYELEEILKVLQDCGISNIVSTTGTVADTAVDNSIFCHKVSKLVNITAFGHIYTPQQAEMFYPFTNSLRLKTIDSLTKISSFFQKKGMANDKAGDCHTA